MITIETALGIYFHFKRILQTFLQSITLKHRVQYESSKTSGAPERYFSCFKPDFKNAVATLG